MSYLLLDPASGRHYLGDNGDELLAATQAVRFDLPARRCVVRGKPDTVTFSEEYTGPELLAAMRTRALDVLRRHYGFVLYKAA